MQRIFGDETPSVTRMLQWQRQNKTVLTSVYLQRLTGGRKRSTLELHLAAAELPDLGIGKNIDAVSISHDEWSQFFKKFGGLPVNSYFDVFNPLQEEEPVINSLADDLADIYRDLKEGLSLFEANHPIDAAWEWRFGFKPIGGSILSEPSALFTSILLTKASDIVRNPTKPCG